MEENTTIIDEYTIRDKIYEVRGVKVMLDFELAEIYGYTTSAFNQQVKNNIDKFDEDFRFQISREELDDLVKSKKLISRETSVFKGQSGGMRRLPWCFTESGVYMLMTVLKGELAVKQSKALIRIFQKMKNYLADTKGLAYQRDLIRLSLQTNENTEEIRKMQSWLGTEAQIVAEQQKLLMEHDDILAEALEKIEETVIKSDIAPFLKFFELPEWQKEFMLEDGHPVKAAITYMDIYNRANKSIYVVDNYINIKTLNLLQDVKPGVSVTVFSDNTYNKLHAHDYEDFKKEFPAIPVTFISTFGKVHDRYIFLDYDEPDEKIYLCGSSSKDAGDKRMSTITELESADVKTFLHTMIDSMKANNPPLVLQ